MQAKMTGIARKVGAAICSLLLAVTLCICPYAQAHRAYAVLPIAAAPLGYALCAVLAACGVAVTVNSDSQASNLASSFGLYTDDLDVLSGEVQALMSAFAMAAKASGEGVEYTPAPITADDVQQCADILSAAGSAGSLALDQISPYLDAATLSPIPFIIQAYLNKMVSFGAGGAFAQLAAQYTWTQASTSLYSNVYQRSISYLSKSQAVNLAPDVSAFQALNHRVKSCEYVTGSNISVSASDVLYPIYAYIDPSNSFAPIYYCALVPAGAYDVYVRFNVSTTGYTPWVYYSDDSGSHIAQLCTFSGASNLAAFLSDSDYLTVSMQNSSAFLWSNDYNLTRVFSAMLPLYFSNELTWPGLTDNPDVNLGRDYWGDATQAVKGGIVAGTGVAGLLGGGSVTYGGQVYNKGRLGVPTSWSGVDSWADALDRTGSAVGSDVWARYPATSTTVTGAGVDAATGAATGELVQGAFDSVTKPNNPGGTISIASPVTGATPDFSGGSAVFMDKFPFCIPSDIYRITKCLVVSPSAPKFTYPIWSPDGYVDLEVDLSDFDNDAVIARGMLSVFCVLVSVILSLRFIQLARDATGK